MLQYLQKRQGNNRVFKGYKGYIGYTLKMASKRKKVSDQQAREIVELRPMPLRQIAARYGVSLSCVARIARGERRNDATGVRPEPATEAELALTAIVVRWRKGRAHLR